MAKEFDGPETKEIGSIAQRMVLAAAAARGTAAATAGVAAGTRVAARPGRRIRGAGIEEDPGLVERRKRARAVRVALGLAPRARGLALPPRRPRAIVRGATGAVRKETGARPAVDVPVAGRVAEFFSNPSKLIPPTPWDAIKKASVATMALAAAKGLLYVEQVRAFRQARGMAPVGPVPGEFLQTIGQKGLELEVGVAAELVKQTVRVATLARIEAEEFGGRTVSAAQQASAWNRATIEANRATSEFLGGNTPLNKAASEMRTRFVNEVNAPPSQVGGWKTQPLHGG